MVLVFVDDDVIVFVILAVREVCSDDEIVVVAVCVLDLAELSVCDTETVLVFELLAEPVCVGVPVLLFDCIGLAEYVAEKLLIVDAVGENVLFELAERLKVSVFDTVFVTEIFGLDEVVLDGAPAAETVLEAEGEDVTVCVTVCLTDFVWVYDAKGLWVNFIDPDFVTDAVDVLLPTIDFVVVIVPLSLELLEGDPVCVLETLAEAEYVDVTVEVFVPAIDFVGVELVVVVLDDVVVAVPVAVLGIVFVICGDKENDGLADDVLETAEDRVVVGDPELVFETAPVLDIVGVPLEVFDIVVVEVCVLDSRAERVSADVPEFVFDSADEAVDCGEDDDVLDDEAVRVDVIVDVTVFVVVLDGVSKYVGGADFVDVVVFVDVLLVVEVCVGKIPPFASSSLLILYTLVKSYSTNVFSEFVIVPNIRSRAVRRSILNLAYFMFLCLYVFNLVLIRFFLQIRPKLYCDLFCSERRTINNINICL